MGIDDILNFDFLDPPVEDTLIRACSQLYALGAFNDRGQLTKLGRRMAEFPMDPTLSKSIVAAEKYECTEEVVSICAMLSEQSSLLYRPKDKKLLADTAHQNLVKPGGDHLTLLNIWNQWVETDYSIQWCYENFIQHKTLDRVRNVRDQLVQLLDRVEVPLVSNPNPADVVPIQKALTSGFFFNAARLNRSGESYRTIKQSQTVHIHPSSSLLEKRPKWLIYFELVLTSKEYMRQVLEIQPQWLLDGKLRRQYYMRHVSSHFFLIVAPHYYTQEDLNNLDDKKKMPKQPKKQ